MLQLTCQVCPTSIFKLFFPISGAAWFPALIPACEISVMPELLRSFKPHLLDQTDTSNFQTEHITQGIHQGQAAHPSQSPKPHSSNIAHSFSPPFNNLCGLFPSIPLFFFAQRFLKCIQFSWSHWTLRVMPKGLSPMTLSQSAGLLFLTPPPPSCHLFEDWGGL